MVKKRSDRTLRSVTRSKGLNSTKKRKSSKYKPPEDTIQTYNIEFKGVHLDSIHNEVVSEVSQEFFDNIFEIIPNDTILVDSIFQCLSQYLYGKSSRANLLKETICIRKCNNSKDVINLIQTNYNLHVIVFESHEDRYQIVHVVNSNGSPSYQKIIYMLLTEFKQEGKKRPVGKYNLLQVKQGKRRQIIKPDEIDETEYSIGEILGYRYPKGKYTNLETVEFLVHWENHSSDSDSYEPWELVKDAAKLDEFLERYKHQRVKPKFVKDLEALDPTSDNQDVEPPPQKSQSRSHLPIQQIRPRRKTRRKKKKLTGRKFTIIGDLLELKNKGGIYSYYPYERLDERNKGIFKVGMSTDFQKRFESVHSYYPEGIYLVAFYSNPIIPEMTSEQLRHWRRINKTDKKPTKEAKAHAFYMRMERFIFKYLEEHRAKRFYSTTRVKFPNEDKKGATEYFYTTEDLIHEAFEEAKKKFPGGKLQQFYLHGIDPDTGLEVESINQIAKERENSTPNFTGKLIYRL